MIEPPPELSVVRCQAGGLVAVVVDEVPLVAGVVLVPSVVFGARVVVGDEDVDDVEGDAATTPASGRSFTSEPAAFTATYATVVVAAVARSQRKNRELRRICSFSPASFCNSSRKSPENFRHQHPGSLKSWLRLF